METPLPKPDKLNSLNVGESRAKRLERQHARMRDRGGIFRPENNSNLFDLLRTATHRKSPTKGKGRSRSRSVSPLKKSAMSNSPQKPQAIKNKKPTRRSSTRKPTDIAALAPVSEVAEDETEFPGKSPKGKQKVDEVHEKPTKAKTKKTAPARKTTARKPRRTTKQSATVNESECDDTSNKTRQTKPRPRGKRKKQSADNCESENPPDCPPLVREVISPSLPADCPVPEKTTAKPRTQKPTPKVQRSPTDQPVTTDKPNEPIEKPPKHPSKPSSRTQKPASKAQRSPTDPATTDKPNESIEIPPKVLSKSGSKAQKPASKAQRPPMDPATTDKPNESIEIPPKFPPKLNSRKRKVEKVETDNEPPPQKVHKPHSKSQQSKSSKSECKSRHDELSEACLAHKALEEVHVNRTCDMSKKPTGTAKPKLDEAVDTVKRSDVYIEETESKMPTKTTTKRSRPAAEDDGEPTMRAKKTKTDPLTDVLEPKVTVNKKPNPSRPKLKEKPNNTGRRPKIHSSKRKENSAGAEKKPRGGRGSKGTKQGSGLPAHIRQKLNAQRHDKHTSDDEPDPIDFLS